MTAAATLAALRETLGDATLDGGGATSRIVLALESIGWRGGDSADAADVAPELLPAIVAAAREHGDVGLMYRQMAEVLRGAGPLLDGGLPPVADYIPAAAEIVRHFIA